MKEAEEEYLSTIGQAIEQGEGLSFRYLRPDGRIIKHNAVYPREIFTDKNHIYFKAHCYFTRDVRSFRLDRVQSLRSFSKKEPLTLRHYIVVLAVIVLGFTFYMIWTLTGGDPKGEWVLVTSIMDGDTIAVGRGWRYTKVRLIGIDAPETVHPEKDVGFFGPEASKFTERQLKRRRIHLEFEPSNLYDHYGRLLAYVFLLDGTLFNAELLKQGYARVIAPSPFKRYSEFRLFEQEARRAGAGLWAGKDLCKEIIGNKRSRVYRLPGDAGCRSIEEENRIYFNTEEEAIRAGYRRARTQQEKGNRRN